MKRLLAIALALMSLVSCLKLMMDPYEGGDGARASINGRKCVMVGYVGSDEYARYSEYANSSVFISNFYLANRILTEDAAYLLNIKLESGTALATGVEYRIGGGDATLVPPGSQDVETLSGWIKFTVIDTTVPYLEACFELSSPKYSVKHGFMRLPIDYTNHTGS